MYDDDSCERVMTTDDQVAALIESCDKTRVGFDNSRGEYASRATISRKRYDEETAKLIAHHSNGCNSSDFNRVDECLYLTPNGNYFLTGEGRDAPYGSPGGGRRPGKLFVAFDSDTAMNWLELRGHSHLIEQYVEVSDA